MTIVDMKSRITAHAENNGATHNGSAAHRPAIQLLSAAEIRAMPDAEPLIAGVLFRQTLVLLYAAYSSFKSFLMLDWALHIAAGMDTWLERKVTHGIVVYIYAEGTFGIKQRVNAWLAANNLADIGNIYFVPTSVMINDPLAVDALIAAIRAISVQPILVIIDTVHRNMRGDESSAQDAGAFVIGCDRMRNEFKATVVAVHHSGWQNDHSRGSSAFPSDADTEIRLDRDGARVTITCKKQKDAAEFAPITLETFPIAGSLALKPVGLSSPELTPNETKCLTAVQTNPTEKGLTLGTITKESGVPRSSTHKALTRLESLGYVRKTLERYSITEAGKLASVQKSNESPSTVPSSPEIESKSPEALKGLDCGLSAGLCPPNSDLDPIA